VLSRGGPGGWLILDEPELHLQADIVVPDLAGWRRTRLDTVPDEPFLELAPDWVCEIVSPSTERLDRVMKLDIYAREYVGQVWLVNPIARTLMTSGGMGKAEGLRYRGEVPGFHSGPSRVSLAVRSNTAEPSIRVTWKRQRRSSCRPSRVDPALALRPRQGGSLRPLMV